MASAGELIGFNKLLGAGLNTEGAVAAAQLINRNGNSGVSEHDLQGYVVRGYRRREPMPIIDCLLSGSGQAALISVLADRDYFTEP